MKRIISLIKGRKIILIDTCIWSYCLGSKKYINKNVISSFENLLLNGGNKFVGILPGSKLKSEFNDYLLDYDSSLCDLYGFYTDNEDSLEIIETNRTETQIFDSQVENFINKNELKKTLST
ncbi:hypothetical protein [Spiroplasma sp. SV19]|uniref:hypothetical protein n=1 Tax=Spiroplasma sp. SV19 TaxID=2570468 RepID=UPI0024B84208|nr:hypothetical protein [Spiroplasma sp. SV19]WHQ37053.1 hypothetical protein E7Y35_04045 [Spiroplasma sp. SV19]